MLQEALTPAVRDAPWLVVSPGVAIVLTLLAFSLLGEGLRVALDRSILQGSTGGSPQ